MKKLSVVGILLLLVSIAIFVATVIFSANKFEALILGEMIAKTHLQAAGLIVGTVGFTVSARKFTESDE